MKNVLDKGLAYLSKNKWLWFYVGILLFILPLTAFLSIQQQNLSGHAAAIPLSVDIQTGRNQSTAASSIVSPTFSTRSDKELIVVFLASDGPTGQTQTFSSVTGGGLAFQLANRANGQRGVSEVWYAYSDAKLTNIAITATRQNGSFIGLMRVITFKGAGKTLGLTVTGSGETSIPRLQLTTTKPGSLVFGIGNDPIKAQSRTAGVNQKILQQFIAKKAKQTFWVQRQVGLISGIQTVELEAKPITDSWNMVGVEVLQVEQVATPTPIAELGQIYSLWPATAVPTSPSDPEVQAVEVGVKFKTDVAGAITGIRYYKSSANTGTHIGNLWTSTGEKLATATFTNETEIGWQQVNFAQPVQITPNTIYVASYHTTVGHYAGDNDYFATQGVDNGPLHALANSVSSNGVYKYGTSGFPNLSYRASNYWVDVVFLTGEATGLTPTNVPFNSDSQLPSATPTVPVSAGAGCPPYPAVPDANCTGWQHTGLKEADLKACALPLKAGVVYDSCLFNGEVTVAADNIKVTRSKIVGIVNFVYGQSGSLRGLTLTDVEIDSTGWTDDAAIGNNDYTCIRCHIHGGKRGASVGSNVTIRDSYLHEWTTYKADDHITALSGHGGSNIIVDHNNISCDIKNSEKDSECSSALSIYGDDSPGNSNWTITHNLFNSGSSVCLGTYGEPGKPYPVSNIKVMNNTFGNYGALLYNKPDSACSEFGPVGGWETVVNGIWSGNVDINGKPVNP